MVKRPSTLQIKHNNNSINSFSTFTACKKLRKRDNTYIYIRHRAICQALCIQRPVNPSLQKKKKQNDFNFQTHKNGVLIVLVTYDLIYLFILMCFFFAWADIPFMDIYFIYYLWPTRKGVQKNNCVSQYILILKFILTFWNRAAGLP